MASQFRVVSEAQLIQSLAKIIRFIPWFPFNVAAQAGDLFGAGCLSCEHGISCTSHIFSSYWCFTLRAGIIKLAAIDEFSVFVEQVKIGGAGGLVVFCGLLAIVIEVGERKFFLLYKLNHFFRAVVRMGFDAVGVDGHNAESFGYVLVGEPQESIHDMHYKRAVVAYECDQQRVAVKIIQ